LYQFEHGDLHLIKTRLGKNNILTGLYPIENFRYGEINQIVDQTKQFLDIMAPEGNFEFMADKSPLRGVDIDQAHYTAIFDTVRDYGTY